MKTYEVTTVTDNGIYCYVIDLPIAIANDNLAVRLVNEKIRKFDTSCIRNVFLETYA